MTRGAVGLLAALSVVPPSFASERTKGERPKLELRASPRLGFSPLDVLFTLELKGGDDLEQYYCPELEWEWDDGGKSKRGGDCDPYEPGTKIERRFTASHRYLRAGVYEVQVWLLRSDRRFAHVSTRVTVRPGLTDPSQF